MKIISKWSSWNLHQMKKKFLDSNATGEKWLFFSFINYNINWRVSSPVPKQLIQIQYWVNIPNIRQNAWSRSKKPY